MTQNHTSSNIQFIQLKTNLFEAEFIDERKTRSEPLVL